MVFFCGVFTLVAFRVFRLLSEKQLRDISVLIGVGVCEDGKEIEGKNDCEKQSDDLFHG